MFNNFNNLAKSLYFSILVFIFKGLILGYKHFSLSLWDCNTLYQDSCKWYLIFAFPPQAHIAKPYTSTQFLLIRRVCKEDIFPEVKKLWRGDDTRKSIFPGSREQGRRERAQNPREMHDNGYVGGRVIQFPAVSRLQSRTGKRGQSRGTVTGTRLWPVSSGLIPRQNNPANLISTSPTSLRRPNSPLYVTGTLEGLGPRRRRPCARNPFTIVGRAGIAILHALWPALDGSVFGTRSSSHPRDDDTVIFSRRRNMR